MPNKYSASSKPEVKKEFDSIGSSLTPNNKKPRLHKDGALEVENITERSHEGLSFSLDAKGENFLFTKPLDENTSVEFIPRNTQKLYKTKVKKTFSVKNALAVYEGEVKRFMVEKLGRFKSLRKAHKKQVKSIKKTKNDYIFTEKRSGFIWSKPYISSTILGPYNCDVKLVTKRDVELINDIIIVKTGESLFYFSDNSYSLKPIRTKIVWVSPHQMVNYYGSGNYVCTGEYISVNTVEGGGIVGDRSFKKRNNGITNNEDCFALTSKFAKISSNSVIQTEMEYTFFDEENQYLRSTEPIPSTLFYSFYDEYRNVCETGNWSGVIPSGTPISIDVWSTNPRYIGFDGDIDVVPVDENLAASLDFSHEVEAEASAPDYQASVRLAVDKAKRKFYKKLNNHLISKGIKKENAKTKRFELLLERVAQNVFDGLTLLRNEQVAKTQGTEKLSPLDSPVYYDGTSKLYGGSEELLNFDNKKTTEYRSQGIGVGILPVYNNQNGQQGY